ncbi:MAG: LAGLIDADG family homing endonuclease [Chloroflexi bacterium]|nr:LAGLIDADG family homing endonuclease [Chloroflexota bacterium]
MVTETELAYAAGIVDGEGSVSLIRSRPTRFPSPQVSVCSTDRELVEWFKARFGGTIVRKRKRLPHHSDAYDWKLIDRNALRFLALVRPYLTIQRKIARADLLLDLYLAATPRNGRYDEETLKRKQELIERFSSLP